MFRMTGEFQRCICTCEEDSDDRPFFSFSCDRSWRRLCHRWSRNQPQPGSFSNDQKRQKTESLRTRLTAQCQDVQLNVAISRIITKTSVKAVNNAFRVTSLV